MSKITITIETDNDFSSEHIFMGNDPARFAGCVHRAVFDLFMDDVLSQGVYHTGQNNFMVTAKNEHGDRFSIEKINATKYNKWGKNEL